MKRMSGLVFVFVILTATWGMTACGPPTSENPDGGGNDAGLPDSQKPPTPKPPAECAAPTYAPSKTPDNGGKTVELDELDKKVFALLYRSYHANNACHAQIWGGNFKLQTMPTYLVNYGAGLPGQGQPVRAFLINHPKPPSGATLVDAKLVHGIPKVHLYNGDATKVPENGFSFDLQINGSPTYAMIYSTGQDTYNPDKPDFIALFAHEAFHRVQLIEEKWQDAEGDQDTAAYPWNKENLALALLEDKVLLAGYTKKIDAETALKQFYAIRALRIKQDSSSQQLITKYDNFQEWLEGTAQYTETNFMYVLGMGYDDSVDASIETRLRVNTILDGQGFDRAGLRDAFIVRHYGTGGAIGFLLDRVQDAGWKPAVRKGTTLFDYLKQKYASLDANAQNQLITQAKKDQNYTESETLAAKYAATQ